MRASLKGTAGTDKKRSAGASFGVPAGDLKLRASITEATFLDGPSLNGLVLTVERPGSFVINFDVPKQDFRFQFMNKVNIGDKPLNITYIHSKGDNRTILDGSLAFNPKNKLSANYLVGPGNCKLKYSYVHRGLTTIEPSYDLSKNSWDFAVSRKILKDDVVKATYQTSSRILGLEWTLSSFMSGNSKISASVNMNEESKFPDIKAETTWNFDL